MRCRFFFEQKSNTLGKVTFRWPFAFNTLFWSTFVKMIHGEFTLSTSLPLEPTMSQGINVPLQLSHVDRYDCGTWGHCCGGSWGYYYFCCDKVIFPWLYNSGGLNCLRHCSDSSGLNKVCVRVSTWTQCVQTSFFQFLLQFFSSFLHIALPSNVQSLFYT